MNYKAHKWKWLIGLGFCAAIASGVLWWQFDDQEEFDPMAEFVTPVSRKNAKDAQELMAAVPNQLAAYTSLQANLRQRVNLLGCEMTGAGSYLQGDPHRRQTRLEFRLQFEEAVLSWRQFCDGRSLWSAKKGLDGRTKISRVDLRDIDRQDPQAPNAFAWGAGGLPQFMASLDDAFEFVRVDKGWLDDMPARIVHGRWHPERLEKVIKEEPPPEGEPWDVTLIPDHLPQAIAVTLGADDLFPYRIEFFRANEQGKLVAIVTMELFEVDYRAELTDAQFEFDPGEVEIRDGTQDFLKVLNWTAEN
ncbi:MAG: hypothetical protein MPJ50_18670 [Pirellulales bacterium]|nr:hypothetical protein [Pirellulales bacterium]